MKYYDLKSMVAARKKSIEIAASSHSFFIPKVQGKPYIHPSFQKYIFDTEQPPIILISAVGATGKTALAENLSHDIGLPLFDLAKHKPVGDNTLTGLLTSAFEVKQISAVLEGLATGTFGVIIDGVDEGRSKTNEKAFEAFLDDIARLCRAESGPTFVMLGRTQILYDCWAYLSEQGIPTALITISPFTLTEAREYIDTFVGTRSSATYYATARDTILDKLARAFTGTAKEETPGFLSFIGYPPVLEAIVTLLAEEQNYHKLLNDLGDPEGQNVELSLLNRIAQYILRREREEKIIPNILRPLLEDTPAAIKKQALAEAFSTEEQCVRLVAHCLNRSLTLSPLGEQVLDEQYEAQLSTVLPDHPFVAEGKFRNAIFEALALATLMTSATDDYLGLALDYLASHKHSYYLVYMLNIASGGNPVALATLGPLLTAAMEFSSVRYLVELRVYGPDWDGDFEARSAGELEIEIEIVLRTEAKESQMFEFRTEIMGNSRLLLDSVLGGAFISVPCDVELGGSQELELIAPLEISARNVTLNAKALFLRTTAQRKGSQPEVIINSQQLTAMLATIATNGIPLVFALADTTGVAFPAIQYVARTPQLPTDPLLRQKYLRFRRILMEFRSHSKGALARYKGKIESERVLKGSVGQAVLGRLIQDGILSLQGEMYYLNPEQLNAHAGVSWQDLRKGMMPDAVSSYLRAID